MNFDNSYQIKCILNLLDPNYSGFKYDNINKIEDPLYYIEKPKKVIKFINSDYTIYKVKVPEIINKSDLYSIAKHYKYYNNSDSNILLIYKNEVLNEDNSSIESILENDKIRIIELRNYPDDSYYNLLSNKYDKDKMNIVFIFQTGLKANMVFSGYISVFEMCKAFYLRFGLENDYTYIFHSGNKLNYKDKSKLINSFLIEGSNLIVINCQKPPITFGKIVEVRISYTDKEINSWIFEIGLLNSVNCIIRKNESFYKRKVKKLMIRNRLINIEDQRCLSDIGINNNFNCLIEFELP